MASLFISYSRKDIEVARKLTNRFSHQDLDFWVDWEGIPPTVDWWQEVEKGIEEADIFLFLLSPDSAGSKVCRQEISHAVNNGKRLIPVVVRDIKADECPTELSHLNWIFLREQDDFNLAFGQLITALKTDYAWVQAHRQLQVKALEWERSGHKSGFLLHREELDDAEIQLATNSIKEPQPTRLQREYVLRSRQATTREQRRIIGGLFSFAAIVLVLLIFSLIELNISRGQQLGSQAQAAFAQQKYNTALLYAYQSDKIHQNNAADLVLGQIPYENFAGAVQLNGHSDDVYDMAWSADGRLASGSRDNTVIVWDLDTSRPAQTLKGHTSAVSSVAWSPDGRLASGSVDNTVILWDLNTGQPAQTLQGHTASVTSVAWLADGRLASGSDDRSVTLWDLKTGQPAQILEEPAASVYSLAWSPDGRLASGLDDNTVILWDLDTGQPAQILKGHTDPAFSVAWSADGRLASGSSDGTIILWDLDTGQPAQTLKGHTNSVFSVAWSADGRLASGSQDNTLILWDLKTGQPAQTLKGHTDYVLSVAWSADGRLASGSQDNTIKIARADLIDGDLCHKIHRNMTVSEWLSLQGTLYVYQPACPNLPVPAFDPIKDILNGDISSAIITWPVRAFLLGSLVALLAILFGILWILQKLASGVWYKRKTQSGKRPSMS